MWEMIDNTDDCLVGKGKEDDIESVHEVDRRKARIRWFVAFTLVNNPSLVEMRKREMQKAEEEKGTCKIKEFATKVVHKIEDMREKKHETKL